MNEFTKHPFFEIDTEEKDKTVESELFAKAQLLSCPSDQISGLTLKHFLKVDLNRRIYESSRYEIPVSICLIRVQNFIPNGTSVRDGASAIRVIARIIENEIRLSDLATWCSPNDFLIEMPHSTLAEALDVGNRIKAVINEHLQGKPGAVSVLAEQVQNGDTADSLLARVQRQTQCAVNQV